jgi:hypothetical protein
VVQDRRSISTRPCGVELSGLGGHLRSQIISVIFIRREFGFRVGPWQSRLTQTILNFLAERLFEREGAARASDSELEITNRNRSPNLGASSDSDSRSDLSGGLGDMWVGGDYLGGQFFGTSGLCPRWHRWSGSGGSYLGSNEN